MLRRKFDYYLKNGQVARIVFGVYLNPRTDSLPYGVP